MNCWQCWRPEGIGKVVGGLERQEVLVSIAIVNGEKLYWLWWSMCWE